MLNAIQSNRMRITIAMVIFFIIYAIIGIFVCMQESNLNLFPKFAIPLALWAVATIMLSESIRKLGHDKQLVRILAIIALITTPICAVLYLLLTWEIIPASEQATVNASYGLYNTSYTTSVPSMTTKITCAIAYISALGFLGSVVLAFKNNGQKLIFPISLAAVISLACATITGIISLFSDSSNYFSFFGAGGNIQMTIFSVFSWISFIALMAVAFYLSKFGKTEDKDSLPSPVSQASPQSPSRPVPHPETNTPTVVNNSKPTVSPHQSLGAKDLKPLHPITFNESDNNPAAPVTSSTSAPQDTPTLQPSNQP